MGYIGPFSSPEQWPGGVRQGVRIKKIEGSHDFCAVYRSTGLTQRTQSRASVGASRSQAKDHGLRNASV